MIENPFFHRRPIRDPAYFYNRAIEVKRTLEMLGKGQCVSITGPRKIGKTSLLFHLARPEVLRQHGLDPATHLVAYFTCEGIGTLKLEEFYALILHEILGRAADQGYRFDYPVGPVPYLEFEHVLRNLFDRGLKLSVLFDEFELLGDNRDWGMELLSGLRSLATRFNIAYLTASQRQIAAFTRQHSPFFNVFFPLKLRVLDEMGSRELVEKSVGKVGAKFSPDAVDCILELGGRHPFFLQVVGIWALELQSTKGALLAGKDFDILTQTDSGEVASHFVYYWKHLTPREKYVLAALPLVQSEETYREELETLANLCLIVKDGDEYRYFSPLFHDFVRRQEVGNLLQTGPLVLALPGQRALLGERPLPLSARQFALLSYFMERQGQVVSNEELDREVISVSTDGQEGYQYVGDERVKSAIRDLRRALGEVGEYVVNKRGVGYVLQIPAEQ